jgi:hypothetical protein
VRHGAALALALVAALALSACGGGDGPELSDRQRAELTARVDSARNALVSYNPDAARAELAALRAQVTELQRRDRISEGQAAEVLAAAAALEADLGLAPTTTTTTTTTTTAPAPVDDRGDDGNGKGPKPGKGRGKED